MTQILGADGRPIARERGDDFEAVRRAYVSSFADAYSYALQVSRADAQTRARDPLRNHPWTMAAVVVTALVASSTPYVVWQDDELQRSGQRVRAGRGRRARQRRLGVSADRRVGAVERKEMVALWADPLMDLLERPNPYQHGNQLMQSTFVLLAAYGCAYWVLTDEDGAGAMTGGASNLPARIWPMPQSMIEPVLADGQTGEVIGYDYTPQDWMPRRQGAGRSEKVRLVTDDVIAFKIQDPENLLGSLNPLAAVAPSIEVDMLIQTMNRALLENDGVPRGVIKLPLMMDKGQRDELAADWQKKYGGPKSVGRTAFLYGDAEYMPLSTPPAEMAFKELTDLNREQQLAVLNTPPSILGLTQFTNYATALAQDRNFWDKRVRPLQSIVEMAIEASSLMRERTDDVFGAFDLSDVEALRVGLAEKVEIAKGLAGPELSMPPRQALETAGLKAPSYDGDDQAPVPALMVPAGDAGTMPDEPPADDAASPAVEEESRRWPGVVVRESPAARARRVWLAFVRAQLSSEVRLRREYRRWILAEQEATLAKIKRVAESVVLPNLGEMRRRLGLTTRPSRAAAARASLNLLARELDIPVMEMDDARVVNAMAMRERVLLRTVPQTILGDLQLAIREGNDAGETVQQIRTRVGRVFSEAASSARVLRVARTETAAVMSSVRDEQFRASGFTEHEWTTAGDEVVRDSHVAYGRAGPKPIGFNWMTLTGGFGTLQFPGDPRAPAAEVLQCRCVMVPVI